MVDPTAAGSSDGFKRLGVHNVGPIVTRGVCLDGDAVYLHTGWGRHWMKDNATFTSGEPGIGMDAGRWLVSKQIVMCGSDNWGIEVIPNPNPRLAFLVHQEFITRHGIYNHENCATEVLVQNDVREFLMMFAPLKLKGATGSPGAPIAII